MNWQRPDAKKIYEKCAKEEEKLTHRQKIDIRKFHIHMKIMIKTFYHRVLKI